MTAASKFTTWDGKHSFTEFFVETHYDVYADMTDASVQPFLKINTFYFQSTEDDVLQFGDRLPMTLSIQIGENTPYSFTVTASPAHKEGYIWDYDTETIVGGYYYFNYSDDTQIMIPGNATPFTISTTITCSNGDVYSYTENACGPMANAITGQGEIQTCAASRFELASAVQNTASFQVVVPSAYVGPYTPIEEAQSEITWFEVAPSAGRSGRIRIDYTYFYYTGSSDFGGDFREAYQRGVYSESGAHIYPSSANVILISRASIEVNVVAGEASGTTLLPVADRVRYMVLTGIYYNDRVRSYMTYDQIVTQYGGAVQGKTTFDPRVTFKMPYGQWFTSYDIEDNTRGTIVTDHRSVTASPGKMEATISYNTAWPYDVLDTVVTNAVFKITAATSFGQTVTYQDTVTVLPYHAPEITTCKAMRCSEVSDGSGEYSYGGKNYTQDDYGEYCVVEWGVSYSSVSGQSNKRLWIDTKTDGEQDVRREFLASTSGSHGFFVFAADSEKSYDFGFTAMDDFDVTKSSTQISTVLAVIDFLHGGNGVAFGKVAEYSDTFDISRDWLLRIPEDAEIGDYNGSGGNISLKTWMANTLSRMQAIVDSRPVAIYYNRRYYDGQSTTCLPEGGATIDVRDVVTVASNTRAALIFTKPVVVSREYLHFERLGIEESFAGASATTVQFTPTVYIMGTEPTGVNQSTGVPIGTILTSQPINCRLQSVGPGATGSYQYWYQSGVYPDIYIDISRWMGQSIWIAITVASGLSDTGDDVVTGELHFWNVEMTRTTS